jgi:outer membrane autotransporter protein
MKKNLITLAMRNKIILLPALAVAGNILFAPAAMATVFNNTVDINSQTLAAGDTIVTSDARGITSTVAAGGAPLQINGGAIEVDITATTPSQHVYGAYLANQTDNDFGQNSKITINQNVTTTTYYTQGVYLSNQSSMSASGLDLSITSTNISKGIVGDNYNTVDLGNNSKINVTTTGTSASGVYLGSNGQLSANALSIDVHGKNTATGVYSTGANVNLGSGSKIKLSTDSNGNTSYGLEVSGNSIVEADHLEIEGTNASGILAGGTSNLNLGSGSKISTTGNANGAIRLLGTDVNFQADGLTLATTGNNAYGLNLNYGSHIVDLGSNSSITTEGADSRGIWMIGRADSVFTADALTIHTKGQNSNAMDVRNGNATIGAGSVLTSENAGTLVVYTSSGAASATVNDSKLISGGSFAASAQGSTAVINLNNVEAEVDRNGGTAYALWAVSGGKINVDTIKIDAASGVFGMVANGTGKITLANDITVSTQSGIAMITSDANSSITGSGKMLLDGQLIAQNSALLDLTMHSGSRLNGAVNQTSGGTANLTMDNTVWRFDEDSSVNNLTMTGGSSATFDTATDGLLTVTNLAGNGKFIMRTDIVNASGDLIDVTGTTSGSHQLQVVNNGANATDGTETLTVVRTADGLGSFGLTNSVELGGYLYSLRQTGNDWELYSSGRAITPTANASVGFLNAGYLMNYAETQTLLQRMGDLRQGSDSGNAWVRVFHGSFGSFADAKLSGFDMDYRGLQIGADKATTLSGGTFYSGVFAGLADSQQDYAQGEGKLKSSSVGLYGSYMFNSGTYIDGVVKYQHHRNKLNITDTMGNGVNGKGNADGLSVSLESGHRFHLTGESSGVYVEPQLQLTYAWQDGTTIDNSNGLRVDLDSYNSLLGRAGAVIGYEVNKAGTSPVNIYLKNSWLQEFDGKTHYRLNGSKEDLSFKGGAWVSGVGVSTQLNRRHTLFLDMEKTTGKKFNQDQINVGYRLSF